MGAAEVNSMQTHFSVRNHSACNPKHVANICEKTVWSHIGMAAPKYIGLVSGLILTCHILKNERGTFALSSKVA
jgi:hypothetical protein